MSTSEELGRGQHTDSLQVIIDRQISLHKRFDNDPAIAWGKEGLIRTLLDEADGLIEEAVEFKRELPRKKWKRDYLHPQSASMSAARGEAIDCLHFALNLCIRTGLDTSEKVLAAFIDKNNVNLARQDGGY